MKLKKVLCLALVLLFSITPIFTTISFAKEAKPISSFEDFLNISKNLEGEYYLTNNITVPSGTKFTPLGSENELFDGTLDGKGYSIIGLNITPSKTKAGSSHFGGLFCYNRGTIKNLNLVDATINSATNKYTYYGMICGINLGTIENSYVSGTLNNMQFTVASYVGGLVGQMYRGSIKNCASYVNVYSKGYEQFVGGVVGSVSKGTIENTAFYGSAFSNGTDASRDSHLGGITGNADAKAKLKNCLFAGSILGEKSSDIYIGGLAGTLKGEAEQCVSYGNISVSEIVSHTYIGGISGDDFKAKTSNTYYLDGIFNEISTENHSKSVKKDAFLSATSFSGLDFASVWGMGSLGPQLLSPPKTPSGDSILGLTGISITSKPNKLKYKTGDQTLDLSGLKVVALYGESKVELSKNQYTVGGYNYVKDGKQTITVTYKGFTDTFQITVHKSGTIISIGNLTEGSYIDATANGILKEQSDTPSTENTISAETPQATSSVVIGNAVSDNLASDDDIEAQESSSSSTKESSHKSPIIILIIIVLALGFASVITILILRFKPKNEEGEIHASTLDEVEYDDADVYNK